MKTFLRIAFVALAIAAAAQKIEVTAPHLGGDPPPPCPTYPICPS